MRKIAASAALALGLGLISAAPARAQLGVKGGANVAVLSGRVGQDASYQTGYHVGAFYEFRLNGPLSIQPEALYSVQGGKLSGAFEDYKTRLHYFAVPVLARLTLGPVFVEAGPQFGILVSANQDGKVQIGQASGSNPPPTGPAGPDAASQYKSTDFALAAGLGANLGQHFRLGSRFVTSLTDINQAQYVTGINDPRLQNRVFQFYLAAQL